MGIIVNAGDVGQDGSVTLTVDGREIRYVKESDLLAVKGGQSGLEGERDKLRTDLANLNTQFNNEHQELLKVRTSYEELSKKVGGIDNLQSQVTSLTTELNKAKELAGQHETTLTTRLRNSLSTGYKVTPDKLEGKSLQDLITMESVLAEAGSKGGPANYDAGGGPGAGNNPDALANKSPLQLARDYYETTSKNVNKEE